ncbi:hypothetical protein PanWU01x14_194300 [Parasponia andersonii]|uniref:Uncharacterized protein n=1 Tax=Parasponia andersonii TaxID=3476 RepID=A0A2P5C0K8_PARAD|nr:hypothetical protein PanWU01x14_194300 [Parasponia andersonii]
MISHICFGIYPVQPILNNPWKLVNRCAEMPTTIGLKLLFRRNSLTAKRLHRDSGLRLDDRDI